MKPAADTLRGVFASRQASSRAAEPFGGPRVTAIAHRENRASRRVMEKIGMTFLRDTTGADLGHRHPEIEVALYAIEREEWLARIGGEPAGDSARRKAPRRSSSR